MVLPVHLCPSLPPESNVKIQFQVKDTRSEVMRELHAYHGGPSGTAVSFGIRHFLILFDLPSALKKGWSPGVVKI